jgi:hypothetical protein
MTTPLLTPARPLHTILTGVAFIVFLLPVIAYIGIALQRLESPVLLEWMEGGSLQMMYRVLSGKPLYAPPSVEFVPYTYTPLYFYVSAAISEITGRSLFPLRLVSFLASLASFLFVFLFVRREARSSIGGMAAVSLFAGSYAVNGNWFDIARIDSLCIALLIAGMWLALGRGRALELVAGGFLVALSFFTKQVAIVVLGPLIVAVMIRHGKTGIYFALASLLFIALGCLALDAIHGGWFLFYVLESPRARWENNLSLHHLARATLVEFLPLCMISIAVSVPAIWHLVRRPTRVGASFLIAVGGLLLAAAWGRVESINFLNSSIPAHLGMALLFGLAVGTYCANSRQARTPLIIAAAFVAQLSVFAALLGPVIPTPREQANASDYAVFLSSLAQPVYLPDQGYVETLGPTNSFAHSIGMMDLIMGGTPANIEPFKREMGEALAAHRFGTIVRDTPLSLTWFQGTLEQNYQLLSVDDHRDIWTPILGFRNRPEIWIPRNAPPEQLGTK